jgi:hypothetical protein|tara:strand:+ start:113423 stop:113896 length:474 start_codon:yes stop_codon:yes gene_type:complete
MKRAIFLALLASTVSGCSGSLSQTKFYNDPSASADTFLCKGFYETDDIQFKVDIAAELMKRGLTPADCEEKISAHNTAMVGMALVGSAAAIAVAANSGSGGSYSAPAIGVDYDCAGGKGDGPYYVYGPKWVGTYDPYHLDADKDGWGCEATDRAYGA